MIKNTTLFLAFFISFLSLQAQYVVQNGEELNNLKALPQEKVYVNHTGPVVFSGEYLYYSFLCFNAQKNQLSDISKVGYIALVNDKKELVVKHKVRLDKGLAQGDIFIGSSMPSGTYKLIAYTNWMQNGGLSQVFKDDIVLINPYKSTDFANTSQEEPVDVTNNGDNEAQKIRRDSSLVQVRFEQKRYRTREKVSFSLKNYKGSLGNGIYSIKISKKNDFLRGESLRAISYAEDYFNVDRQLKMNVGDSIYLPEQRGELFYGTVSNRVDLQPLANVPVVISLPGKDFLLQSSISNAKGNFYTYLTGNYTETMAFVQLEKESDTIGLQLLQPKVLDISGLKFNQFTLNKKLEASIIQRSIHNQIENQFFEQKPDSILEIDTSDPFKGGRRETLDLDDYTRFDTFEETLVEIFNYAGYRKNGRDQEYIRVAQDFETYNEDYNVLPAIVLIDGVFIPNHETIKDFDAKKIKSISVVKDKFRLGSNEYQGMMAIETFELDFFVDYIPQNGIKSNIAAFFPQKNYFVQRYDDKDVEKNNRIPDYRRLLFWLPSVMVATESYQFDFFTSDVTGEFEIMLDGFTTYGKPISITESIWVE